MELHEDPTVIRVGPPHHAYEYTLTTVVSNGFPVYQCRRGRDENADTRLYLYKIGGIWIAGDCSRPLPTTEAELRQRVSPQFRSEADVDVRVEGWHKWQAWNPTNGSWWPGSDFKTTVLREGAAP